MNIRFIGNVQNAHGMFAPGDIADLPDHDAQPLIDCGAAELYFAGAVAAAPSPPIAPRNERSTPPIAPPLSEGGR